VEGLLAVVGLEMTTEGVRTGTGTTDVPTLSGHVTCRRHLVMTTLSTDYYSAAGTGLAGQTRVGQETAHWIGMSVYAAFKKICRPHKHQICGTNMWKYGTELLKATYPISVHRGPDTRMVPFCWQPDAQGNET